MAAPSMTQNIALLVSQALAAGASVSFDWDLQTKFEGQAQLRVDFGATPNGDVLVAAVRLHDPAGTPVPDTIATRTFTIPATASTTERAALLLTTGSWRVTLTNEDSADNVTVEAVGATVDAVS